MFAIIEVLADAVEKRLVFVDEENAQQFINFVVLYQRDSGAGNGYGAYWVMDGGVQFSTEIPRKAESKLDMEMIASMAQRIAVGRTENRDPKDIPIITVGKKDGAIVFSFTDLPIRKSERN